MDLQPDRLLLSLPASKTIRFREGVVLAIVAAKDQAGGIPSLQNLFGLS